MDLLLMPFHTENGDRRRWATDCQNCTWSGWRSLTSFPAGRAVEDHSKGEELRMSRMFVSEKPLFIGDIQFQPALTSELSTDSLLQLVLVRWWLQDMHCWLWWTSSTRTQVAPVVVAYWWGKCMRLLFDVIVLLLLIICHIVCPVKYGFIMFKMYVKIT